MYNAEKWSNILLKSCSVKARFFNIMPGRVHIRKNTVKCNKFDRIYYWNVGYEDFWI